MVLRALIQAASLWLMARAFGPSGYGALAGAVALFATLAQLVGLGVGVPMVNEAVRDPTSIQGTTRIARIIYFWSSVFVLLFAWPLAIALLPATVAPMLLALIALSEIFLVPQLLPDAFRAQAEQRMGLFSLLLTIPSVVRFGVLLAFSIVGSSSLIAFAGTYLGTLAAVVATTVWLLAGDRERTYAATEVRAMVRKGLPFGVSTMVSSAGADLDKTIVLSTQGAEAAGHYTAPLRVVQAVVAPVGALVLSVLPKLFRVSGTKGWVSTITTVAVSASAYGLAAASLLYIAADWIPSVFGSDFEASVELLRLLFFFIILNCMRQVFGAILTGAGFQWRRTFLEAVCAITSVVGLIAVTPRFGLSGAIIVITTVELLYVLVACLIMIRRGRASYA